MAQIHLRIPRDLHDHLRQQAEENESSLNAWTLILLAGASGFKRDKQKKEAKK